MSKKCFAPDSFIMVGLSAVDDLAAGSVDLFRDTLPLASPELVALAARVGPYNGLELAPEGQGEACGLM